MCLSAWAIVFYVILIISLFAGLFLLSHGNKGDGKDVGSGALIGAFGVYMIVAAAIPVVIVMAGVDLWSHRGAKKDEVLSASMLEKAD